MKPDLDAALESIMRRLEAGETLEQSLAGLEPARAAELRPLIEVAQALAALRATPAPAGMAAQRQKFLAQAAAYGREQAQAQERGTIWQQVWAWLARPRWRDALVAATMTLVLGLALLAGALRGALFMHQAEVAPSATFVALVGDTATPAVTAPVITPTPAPQESPTPAPRPTATALPAATPVPLPTLSQPTLAPSPTPIIVTPTLPAPTATPRPTQTPPPVVVTVAPTATPAPPTPTPLPPLPTATERPQRPTVAPTVAPPSATPTREPTVAPTRTRMPGPRIETTPLPTPAR